MQLNIVTRRHRGFFFLIRQPKGDSNTQTYFARRCALLQQTAQPKTYTTPLLPTVVVWVNPLAFVSTEKGVHTENGAVRDFTSA